MGDLGQRKEAKTQIAACLIAGQKCTPYSIVLFRFSMVISIMQLSCHYRNDAVSMSAYPAPKSTCTTFCSNQ